MKLAWIPGLLILACGCARGPEGSPHPSFAALKGLSLASVEKTPKWVRGYYQVKWTFKGKYDNSLLADLGREATALRGFVGQPQFRRVVGNVDQLVLVGSVLSDQSKPGGWNNDGTVTVLETPLPEGPLPTTWWPQAADPAPPTPLAVSPLDGKTKAVAVQVLSQDGRALFWFVTGGDLETVFASAASKLKPLNFEQTGSPERPQFDRKGPNGDFIGLSSSAEEPGLPAGKTVVWWNTQSGKL